MENNIYGLQLALTHRKAGEVGDPAQGWTAPGSGVSLERDSLERISEKNSSSQGAGRGLQR